MGGQACKKNPKRTDISLELDAVLEEDAVLRELLDLNALLDLDFAVRDEAGASDVDVVSASVAEVCATSRFT